MGLPSTEDMWQREGGGREKEHDRVPRRSS